MDESAAVRLTDGVSLAAVRFMFRIPFMDRLMGWDMSYDGFYATDYNQGPGYADAAPAPPTVIINQNFQTDSVRPQFRDYSNVQLPEPGAVAAPPATPTQARWRTISRRSS